MRGTMKRATLAAVVLGLVVASAPTMAGAATESCGITVCVEADAVAEWDCGIDAGYGFYAYYVCESTVEAVVEGRSDLSVPGTLEYAVDTNACKVVFGDGFGYQCGSQAQDIGTCVFAGLGEDSCSGIVAPGGGIFYLYLEPGQCIRHILVGADADVLATATASGTVTKSLPILGEVDSASASETATGSMKALPMNEDTCYFPG